jgi:hypothetical protein
MDIALTPDTYTPSVDNSGNYIDNVPIILHGLYCPCGTRKDKIYSTTGKFASHTKTKKHQHWLITINQNKTNYYVDLIEHKQTLENQQKIIQRLENELLIKNRAIDTLNEQLLTHKTSDSIGNWKCIN